MGEIVREEMAGGERTVSLERRRSKEFGGEEVKKLGSNDEIVRTRGAAVLRPYMIVRVVVGWAVLCLNPAIWEAIAATGWRTIGGRQARGGEQIL
jgi:hypothetical protein